ncbi:MAG: cytidine deaminase [Thermotogae bacterium]|nr:MAG: cytidine deaminase [Thermotogota bacterium]
MTNEELINIAVKAMKRAYAPYSQFKVGAALLTKSGKVFEGFNIENSSYGLSICAERVAIFSAVVAGERNFEKIAIVADTDKLVSPCGACRQVMSEFGDFQVIMTNTSGQLIVRNVSELLPFAFKLKG